MFIIREKHPHWGMHCKCLSGIELEDRPREHIHYVYGFSFGFMGITYCKWLGLDPKFRFWFRFSFGFDNFTKRWEERWEDES